MITKTQHVKNILNFTYKYQTNNQQMTNMNWEQSILLGISKHVVNSLGIIKLKKNNNKMIANYSVKQVVCINTHQMPSEADNPKQNNQNHQRMLHWQLQHTQLISTC